MAISAWRTRAAEHGHVVAVVGPRGRPAVVGEDAERVAARAHGHGQGGRRGRSGGLGTLAAGPAGAAVARRLGPWSAAGPHHDLAGDGRRRRRCPRPGRGRPRRRSIPHAGRRARRRSLPATDDVEDGDRGVEVGGGRPQQRADEHGPVVAGRHGVAEAGQGVEKGVPHRLQLADPRGQVVHRRHRRGGPSTAVTRRPWRMLAGTPPLSTASARRPRTRMPKYEYACKSCGEHIEVKQSFEDAPLTECPHVRRACCARCSPVPGIVLRGPGFYRTDHRSPYRPDGVAGGRRQGPRAVSSEAESRVGDSKGSDSKGAESRARSRRARIQGSESKGSSSGRLRDPARRLGDSARATAARQGHSRGSGSSRVRRVVGRHRRLQGRGPHRLAARSVGLPSAEIGIFGGTGFYRFLDDLRGGGGRHARSGRRRPRWRWGSWAGRQVAFLRPPRRRPRVPAPPGQLPGQPVGAAAAGRATDPGPVLGRVAAAPRQAGRVRGVRPARRPHQRPGRHLLRRSDAGPRVLRRPVLPRAAAGG